MQRNQSKKKKKKSTTKTYRQNSYFTRLSTSSIKFSSYFRSKLYPTDRVTRSAKQLLNFPTRRYPVIGITRRKLGRQRIEFQGGGRRGEEEKKFFPTIHDGDRQKEKEEWRALNGKTPFRGKFENSLKRGQLRRRIQRVENGGHSRVCLRVLARLNAASSSSPFPPPSCHRLFF